jgi:hypothetical protein
MDRALAETRPNELGADAEVLEVGSFLEQILLHALQERRHHAIGHPLYKIFVLVELDWELFGAELAQDPCLVVVVDNVVFYMLFSVLPLAFFGSHS